MGSPFISGDLKIIHSFGGVSGEADEAREENENGEEEKAADDLVHSFFPCACG